MVRLNIAQYITEHIEQEFNKRQIPRLMERMAALEEQVRANNIGVQNVFNEFKKAKESLECLQLIIDANPVLIDKVGRVIRALDE